MKNPTSRRFRPLVRPLDDRLTPTAGALVSTFGTGGLVSSTASDVTTTAAGGVATASATEVRLFSATGAPVTTFGTNGVVTLTPAAGTIVDTLGANITALTDGGLAVAVTIDQGNNDTDVGVFKLTAEGKPDNTFSGDGFKVFEVDIVADGAASPRDIIPLGEGTFAICGTGVGTGGNNNAFVFVSFANGDFDTNFNNGAVKSFVYANSVNSEGNALALVPGVGLVVVGRGDDDVGVATIAPSGTPTFSVAQEIDLEAGASDIGNAVAVTAAGDILVAGTAFKNGATDTDAVVLCFTSTGALNTAFDGDGVKVFDLANGLNGIGDTANDVLITNNGRITVLGSRGSTVNGASSTSPFSARLLASGAFDTTYGTGGLFVTQEGSDTQFLEGDTFANGDVVALTGAKLARIQDSFAVGRQYTAASASNGKVVVTAFNADGTQRASNSSPAAPGGVRVVTVGDLTGDGIDELFAGGGPGGPSAVRLVDGATGQAFFEKTIFEAAFTGGVYVAAGDINGDGLPELFVTPDEGGGPVIVALNIDGTERFRAFGIDDANFRGGARAAIADLNADGVGDLILAAGFGGGPRIAVYDGVTVAANSLSKKLLNDFFVFEETLRNGAFVAGGDVNGDGFADLVAGGGPGGGPRVRILDGKSLLANTQKDVANFFAGDSANRGGVRLAVKDLDGDQFLDVIAAAGTDATPTVTRYKGADLAKGTATVLGSATPFDASFRGGVFVG